MRRTAVILTFATLALARESAAQRPAGSPPATTRTSFTFGLSKGAGALTCPFCSGEGKGGLAGLVGAEKTFKPGLKVGIEADWWLHSDGDGSRSVMALAPVAHFYTSPASPLFFKLGVGIARFTASSPDEELRTTAVAAVFGTGYEFRLSNRNVVIPYLSWMSGGGGTIRLNGAQVTPFGGVSLLQYGVALSKR